MILTQTVRAAGIGAGLSDALKPWRKPFARHDPANVDRLRAQPQIYGVVASDPTVSRLVRTLSRIRPAKALTAINAARAASRAHVWAAAGEHSPLHGVSKDTPLVVDLDATLVNSHSEKEDAPRRGRKATVSTLWRRIWTTGPRAPGSPWRCCCARGTPGPTRPLITSRSPGMSCGNCPKGTGRAGK